MGPSAAGQAPNRKRSSSGTCQQARSTACGGDHAEELRGELTKFADFCEDSGWHNLAGGVRDTLKGGEHQRVKDAETENARLREALTFADNALSDSGYGDDGPVRSAIRDALKGGG